MSTMIKTRPADRRFARVVGALTCVIALLVAIPAVLVGVALLLGPMARAEEPPGLTLTLD